MGARLTNRERGEFIHISVTFRGEGYPHVPMVKRSQYIGIKNPLHKHGRGAGGKNRKNLPTS